MASWVGPDGSNQRPTETCRSTGNTSGTPSPVSSRRAGVTYRTMRPDKYMCFTVTNGRRSSNHGALSRPPDDVGPQYKSPQMWRPSNVGRGGRDLLQNSAREETCHSATLDEIITSSMRRFDFPLS